MTKAETALLETADAVQGQALRLLRAATMPDVWRTPDNLRDIADELRAAAGRVEAEAGRAKG